MLKKYEDLVEELARVSASTEYIRVLKQFDVDLYKSNKEEFEKRLAELQERVGTLLGLLDDTINKEPV